MKRLTRSESDFLTVCPRWPYSAVFISDQAYDRLVEAQKLVAKQGIRLIVTRGLESQGLILKTLHRLARCLGAVVFGFVFPQRIQEIRQIFSANGHDHGGNSIDIAIASQGHRLNLLPYGVFTSRAHRDFLHHHNESVIDTVWKTLRLCGFVIHPNATEAMQIHCEC